MKSSGTISPWHFSSLSDLWCHTCSRRHLKTELPRWFAFSHWAWQTGPLTALVGRARARHSESLPHSWGRGQGAAWSWARLWFSSAGFSYTAWSILWSPYLTLQAPYQECSSEWHPKHDCSLPQRRLLLLSGLLTSQRGAMGMATHLKTNGTFSLFSF